MNKQYFHKKFHSRFFQIIFKNIDNALNGITLRNDIIHRGEVRVAQENRQEFLALSKNFFEYEIWIIS